MGELDAALRLGCNPLVHRLPLLVIFAPSFGMRVIAVRAFANLAVDRLGLLWGVTTAGLWSTHGWILDIQRHRQRNGFVGWVFNR